MVAGSSDCGYARSPAGVRVVHDQTRMMMCPLSDSSTCYYETCRSVNTRHKHVDTVVPLCSPSIRSL